MKQNALTLRLTKLLIGHLERLTIGHVEGEIIKIV